MSRSPKTKILRQMNQLIDFAEERKEQKHREANLRKLNALFNAAEERKRLKKAAPTRRYVRHNANVPYVARSRSRSRSSSRTRRRGRVVDRPIYVPAASSSDDDIEPSGAYLSRYLLYNPEVKPKFYYGKQNIDDGKVSEEIRKFHEKVHRK